ncbi:hypothetical protein SK128_017772 [Halocaridina rubra]|uniref:Uncharacterized protein n=1 Tax=Halocaridina rubra TaxID=373956 RepID=A0AAN9AGP7_HALRR
MSFLTLKTLCVLFVWLCLILASAEEKQQCSSSDKFNPQDRAHRSLPTVVSFPLSDKDWQIGVDVYNYPKIDVALITFARAENHINIRVNDLRDPSEVILSHTWPVADFSILQALNLYISYDDKLTVKEIIHDWPAVSKVLSPVSKRLFVDLNSSTLYNATSDIWFNCFAGCEINFFDVDVQIYANETVHLTVYSSEMFIELQFKVPLLCDDAKKVELKIVSTFELQNNSWNAMLISSHIAQNALQILMNNVTIILQQIPVECRGPQYIQVKMFGIQLWALDCEKLVTHGTEEEGGREEEEIEDEVKEKEEEEEEEEEKEKQEAKEREDKVEEEKENENDLLFCIYFA